MPLAFAMRFPRLIESAEREPCLANGLTARAPRAHQPVGLLLEVNRELLIELLLDELAPQEGTQAKAPVSQHGSPVRTGRPIASGQIQQLTQGGRKRSPGAHLFFELTPSRFRQFVIFGVAIVAGDTPASLDPPSALEAVQRRVKRSLLDDEHIVRHLSDAVADRPPVLRLERQSSQNQHVKRPLWQFNAAGHEASPVTSTRE
jgi:hypothetical protein